MLSKLKSKFSQNPRIYYSMSIAATWAGAGSFIIGTKIAQEAGLIPWLLWAIGNTATCIVFGLFALRFPKLREVANSKPAKIIMGLMAIFQIWLNMNGIYEMLSATVIGSTISYIIVYALSVFFIIFYLKKATFRNVATDNFSWGVVYLLIAVLVVFSIATNGLHGISLGLVATEIKAKSWSMLTLAFGAFFYPTFWELLDYNDGNEDETQKIDMKKPFIYGGLLFGAYLLFVLCGSLTTYSPAVDLIKAILVSLVAISSLSSFLYGTMIDFGKKIGCAVDVVAVATWQLLVPMGVMGVWTMLQNVRIWMVLGMFAIALIWHLVSKRKAVQK